ncbi:hypothetical protein BV20DRAFT_721076 [Pilatotrama ljubarskyi]|nr:hypothetical protein BV20DRAFT_721076 [Pilatotrama ljubarskyi]
MEAHSIPPASSRGRSSPGVPAGTTRQNASSGFAADDTIDPAHLHGLALQLERVSMSGISHAAIIASIDGARFDNVKFLAYSKRKGAVLSGSRSVYANKEALLSVAPDHFASSAWSEHCSGFQIQELLRFTVLGSKSNFEESRIVDIDTNGAEDTRSSRASYDVMCDSDFEEDSEGSDMDDADPIADDLDEASSSCAEGAQPVEGHGEHFNALEGRDSETPVCGRGGHLISLERVAYKTLRAFVYYSIFGTVRFSPLRSQQRTEEEALVDVDSESMHPSSRSDMRPTCSPKSMYRLASEWNVKELKTLAIDAIEASLSPENIWSELLSPFTPFHPEVEAVEVEYLMDHICDPQVANGNPQWFRHIGPRGDGLSEESSRVVFNVLLQLSKRCKELSDERCCPRCRNGQTLPYCAGCQLLIRQS